MLCLGEGQLEFLGNFLGEPAATYTDTSLLDDFGAIGQNKIADIVAYIQPQYAFFRRIIIIRFDGGRTISFIIFPHDIECDVIDKRKRRHLNRMKINIYLTIIQKRFINEITLHCKKTNLTI